jgi:hypothetical protein
MTGVMKEEATGLKVNEEMLFHGDGSVRSLFNSFYLLLSRVVPAIRENYYGAEVSSLSHPKTCREYFGVLAKMLAFEEEESQYACLAHQLQERVAHSVLEAGQDQLLLGELKALRAIKLYSPETAIQESTLGHIRRLLARDCSEELR